MITKKPIQPYGMLCYAQLYTYVTLIDTGVKQMEIYKIIDQEDENAYCSTTPYKNRSGAEKALNRIMKRHVRSIMMKVVKMTGTVRGKNVQEINNAVESVATHRFTIKAIQINSDW